ncbi:hypothetical protein [Streptomyces sp. DASNCL29]|uniref:hypothetical protein n=1 Tax=Streptomyces sp. DASNCL29 TaxID=2583819 RepID=UPI001F0E9D19|nr:hypothetical protein [Streptomyces sp. DASNCL29]
MEPVEDAGAFVDQVVVPFGQQPQDRGLVFGLDGPQVVAEEGDLGDVAGVFRVGLAATAGGQQPGPGRQGGGHVHHLLACGGQLLGEGSAQAAGAFDGEAALGPLLAPAHQLTEGPGVDDEPALGHLVARDVDGDGGVG